MKMIEIAKGTAKSFVDDKDYESLSKRTWYLDNEGYAATRLPKSEGRKHLRMHGVLISIPKGLFVDHRDRNRLNNQRSNLRICTKSQNMMNRGATKLNTSGYKGVVWDKVNNKWVAQIQANNKHIKIGRYKTKEEAAIAYNEAASLYHGEFAFLNKI